MSSKRQSLTLRLRKPVYVYRPSQMLWRVVNSRGKEAWARVPWGDRLRVSTQDHGGGGIARLGVHEPAVTETIYRLVHAASTVVDVGANLGYFTSLLAHRVGPNGRVHAFEPHPDVVARLRLNVANSANGRSVIVYECGVSDHDGEAYLGEPADFAHATGGSAVADAGIAIKVTTLDGVLPDGPIELLKIDIEGHERFALDGAERTLARTRHVVFEELDDPPTAVTRRLGEAGFSIYGIAEAFRGPRLVAPEQLRDYRQWYAPTFLATRDHNVATDVRPDGWRFLRAQAPWWRRYRPRDRGADSGLD